MDPKDIHVTGKGSSELTKNSEPRVDPKSLDEQPVACQVCTGANADGYCKDCSKFLCLNCFHNHTKFDSHASHKLTSLQETATSVREEVKQALTMNCPKHDDPLRVFCETCDKLICRDCTVRNHKDHNYDLVSNCYNKQYQIIQTTLNAVEKKKKDLAIKVTDLTDRENEIKEQGELVKQEIHLLAKGMIDEILQSERSLMEQVDSVTYSKVQVVTSQKKSAERSCGRLEECSGYVKQSLEMDTHQQVLSSKKPMMEQMNGVMEEINVEDYTPIEKCDVRFIKNEKIKLHYIGDISYTSVKNSKIRKIKFHQVSRDDNTFSFPLSIESPTCNSSSVIVPLSSLSCNVISAIPINTTVTSTDHPAVYRIHCTPVIRGSHQVNVQVNGIQLESISVVVPFNPYFDTTTPLRTIEGLNRPFGVTISKDGHVVVTENNGNCVTVLDKEGAKLKSFSTSGDIKLSFPRGVFITRRNSIFISDTNKIQKILMDGKVKVFPTAEATVTFSCPCGITISHKTRQIYVADSYNHCIKVLNPDFTFAFSFGRKGSAEGQFRYPSFITIDKYGIVYVSDGDNNRIQKFTESGMFISSFGIISSPRGIAVSSDNLLYVAEKDNGRISVFSTDGKFIYGFGCQNNPHHFNQPRGIAFDNEGHLYICDHGNNRIVVY